MRFPIRIKMFILVFFILVGATSAVVLKTKSIFFEDKFDFVKQLSNKLTSSTARLVNEKLIGNQNKLADMVSAVESLRKIHSKKEDLSHIIFERNPEFLLVSVQKQKHNAWGTEWSQLNYSQDISKWPESYSETLLRSIDYNAMNVGNTYVFRLADPQGNALFALGVVAEIKAQGQDALVKNIVMGFVSKDFLADVVVEFKGDLNTVLVVDRLGNIISHPDQDLIGKELNNDPIASEIAEGKRTSGVGEYKFGSGEKVVGSYQGVNQSNLFVIATTPMKQAMQAADSLIMTIFVFGLGFLIVGLVLAFVVASKITNPIGDLQQSANKIGAGDFQAAINVSSSDEVGELAKSIDKMRTSLIERDEAIDHSKRALVQSEKMSAFGQLSAGIAHEVKNPLAGILGHAQLAKSKTKDADITKHMDIIEKEARRTKEIVENLMKFARAEKPDLVPTDLHEAVSRAVDLVDHQLSLQGIKVKKVLDPVKQIMGNGNQIQQVLLNIMMNAGHAMEECPVKELTVYLEDKPDCVQIRIKDSGKGMSPEVQKKIFEPFFTTKPAGKGTGLGLSVSFGIVADHKAKIYVESAINQGTTFFIDFPILGAANAPVAGAAPKVEEQKNSANNSSEQMSKDYRAGIDSFDKNRGIVTNTETSGKNSAIPKLDVAFKKAVSDPDKINDREPVRKPEVSEIDAEAAQEFMYSNSTSAKSSKREELKIIEKKETSVDPQLEIETKTDIRVPQEKATDTNSDAFKVKIRKPIIKA